MAIVARASSIEQCDPVWISYFKMQLASNRKAGVVPSLISRHFLYIDVSRMSLKQKIWKNESEISCSLCELMDALTGALTFSDALFSALGNRCAAHDQLEYDLILSVKLLPEPQRMNGHFPGV